MAQKRSVKNINILGTRYTVKKKRYKDDPFFEKNSWDGYCSENTKEIVFCDLTTFPGWEGESPEAVEAAEKGTLRHEIVHAFFNESGLSYSSNRVDRPWTKNEEMIDWFAIQGPKIYRAWEEAGAV